MGEITYQPLRSLIYVDCVKEEYRHKLQHWLYYYHAPESIAKFEPWVTKYAFYNALPTPPQGERFGTYRMQLTEHYWMVNPMSQESLVNSLNEYFPIGRNPLNAAAICQFGLDSDENPAVENCAFELKAPDGKDYLFLNMEFAPRDTVMKWAQQVAGLEEYADHRIVLMTHAYLDAKDQRLSGPCKVTSYEPLVRNGRIVKIKGLPLPDASNGEDLWQKLVRPASNIELVVCGHISGSGFRTDRNSAGKDVHQMLFDAQSMGGGYEGNGGDGWIRILEFMPDGVTVKATTFSPLFAISPTTRQFAWMRDAKNEFTFRFSK